MVYNFIRKHRSILTYGFALAAILFLLQYLQFKLLILDHSMEIYISVIAICFTLLGIWLALKLVSPKMNRVIETVVVEKVVYLNVESNKEEKPIRNNEADIKDVGLSSREVEVLTLMSKGLSNQEIAESLYLSLSTVKSHSSKLFEKMDVKRRTQAIEKAKRLNII